MKSGRTEGVVVIRFIVRFEERKLNAASTRKHSQRKCVGFEVVEINEEMAHMVCILVGACNYAHFNVAHRL